MAKTIFETKDVDGNELKLAIVHPTKETLDAANAVQNQVFKEAVNGGALLSIALDKVMEDQGLWDKSRQKKVEDLARKVHEGRVNIKRGGVLTSTGIDRLSVEDGKKLAFDILDDINEQRKLLSDRAIYNARTADGQADNARFNYLVAKSVVYNETGKTVFVDVTDYEKNNNTQHAADAANKLADIMYSIGTDAESNTVEFRFLKRFSFVDDKLRFINPDGHLTDREGKLVDDEGRLVDKDDEWVDIDGNRVDKEGELLIEELAFLDEDGNEVMTLTAPVVEATEEPEEEDAAEEVSEKKKKEPVEA